MEIFGIGTAELIAILIIMLIVAGPKRMIHWAYILGQYTARLRRMWAETMTLVQKEFEAAGVEVELPKEVPTRGTILREISKIGEKVVSPVTRPVQDTLNEVNAQIAEVKSPLKTTDSNGHKPTPTPDDQENFGTWSAGGSEK